MTVRHVDLSELIDGGPSSDMALSLVASGGGTSLEDVVGRLELSVPPSSMAGETMVRCTCWRPRSMASCSSPSS